MLGNVDARCSLFKPLEKTSLRPLSHWEEGVMVLKNDFRLLSLGEVCWS